MPKRVIQNLRHPSFIGRVFLFLHFTPLPSSGAETTHSVQPEETVDSLNSLESMTTALGQADAVVWMPASPVLGQIFRALGENSCEVVETDVTVPELTTGLGPFEDCIKVMQSAGPPDGDVLYYTPNIGCVKEEWNDGGETNGWDLKEILAEPGSDFDFDADVDGVDLGVFAEDFDREDCDRGEPCEGDFYKDGDVDEEDLAVFTAGMGWVGSP